MILTHVLARLRDSLLAPQGQWADVAFAEDIDTLSDLAGRIATRSCIVMPWRARAGENVLATGLHRQRVEEQFATGIVVRTYDHLMGEDRVLQFDTLRTDLETALAGWSPEGQSPAS